MKEAFFLADSIGVAFGERQVLKAATAWARPGSVTVLLGRNGSGKSTLLRAALGLGPMHYGTVRVGGRAYLRPRLSTLARRGVFFLPDQGSLARGLTLRWHLRALAAIHGSGSGMRMAEEMGMEPLLDAIPHEMSGGEERRAELVVALARQPACLLADEPLNGIAPRDMETVARALRELAARGSAVLVTGHEVRSLLALADEVIWLAAGTTHGLGRPEEAVAHHQFQREYLGAAYHG